MMKYNCISIFLYICSCLTLANADSSPLRHLATNLTSIYFIGDLHGDVDCAKKWIEQTKLVDVTSQPYAWLGEPTDAIVFLGDYVDKGSTSASVLSFVKELQTTFKDNVVSILGNHDFFQVLDAALLYNEEHPHPLGHPQHDYAYSFVHPEEYLESGYSPKRDDDEEIMKAIHDALQHVYERRLEGNVKLCTSDSCVKGQNADSADLFISAPPFLKNQELATKARERLTTWRNEYMKGLYDSGLLNWMIEQPIVAVVGDSLVVHGGLAPNVISYIAKVGKEKEMSVEDSLHEFVNKPFTTFFKTNLAQNGANSIQDRLKDGYAFEIILNMVQHRGYFKGQNGCDEVQTIIDQLKGENVNRISVGHTPRDYAEELCGGKLLASDSSLSRSFRAYGNLYCPLHDAYKTDISGECSSHLFQDQCDGSISVLVRESPDDEWPRNVKHLTMVELTNASNEL